MRELDEVLVNYLEHHYQKSAQQKQLAFRELLALEDPLLFSLIMGYEESSDKSQQQIIKEIKALYSKY